MLIVTLLFVLVSAYSLFGKVRGADLFCDNKYEERDIQDSCAEKESNLESGLVFAPPFLSPSDPLFEFLSSFFYPNRPLVTTSCVLRC